MPLLYPLALLYVIDRGFLRPACAATHGQVNGGRTTKDNAMLCRGNKATDSEKARRGYENLFNDMALPAERNGTW
jgi:hypothetical protein